MVGNLARPCGFDRCISKKGRSCSHAAKANRHGHRDSTMVLLAYRHGLRASEGASAGKQHSKQKPYSVQPNNLVLARFVLPFDVDKPREAVFVKELP